MMKRMFFSGRRCGDVGGKWEFRSCWMIENGEDCGRKMKRGVLDLLLLRPEWKESGGFNVIFWPLKFCCDG